PPRLAELAAVGGSLANLGQWFVVGVAGGPPGAALITCTIGLLGKIDLASPCALAGISLAFKSEAFTIEFEKIGESGQCRARRFSASGLCVFSLFHPSTSDPASPWRETGCSHATRICQFGRSRSYPWNFHGRTEETLPAERNQGIPGSWHGAIRKATPRRGGPKNGPWQRTGCPSGLGPAATPRGFTGAATGRLGSRHG